jgi:phosphoglycerate dehydrogenase-like enzyme
MVTRWVGIGGSMSKVVAVLNALARPLLEPHQPDWLEARYYTTTAELLALAPEAEIGWFDLYNTADMVGGIEQATRLKWLNSVYAGVDKFPLKLMEERGVIFTYGSGINAIPIAEWVVMGMLNQAKGFDKIVDAARRHEWLQQPQGLAEIHGSQVLILGYGAIGQRVAVLLEAFGAEVTAVRRSPGPGMLGPDQWRGELGKFDWIILGVPSTPETEHMIGAIELAAMKPTVQIVNIARGAVIDQGALIEALNAGRIGGAFLDVATPEPLPPENPLWDAKNAMISMHLSGPSSHGKMFTRAVERFIQNLARYRAGEPLSPQVDYKLGY